VARARELVGLACRGLGDEEGAALELDAAQITYEQLRAAPDLVRVAAARGGSSARGAAKRSESEATRFSTGVSVRARACLTARRGTTLRAPFNAPRPAAR